MFGCLLHKTQTGIRLEHQRALSSLSLVNSAVCAVQTQVLLSTLAETQSEDLTAIMVNITTTREALAGQLSAAVDRMQAMTSALSATADVAESAMDGLKGQYMEGGKCKRCSPIVTVCQFSGLPVRLFACLPVCLFACLPVCRFACLHVRLFACLFVFVVLVHSFKLQRL